MSATRPARPLLAVLVDGVVALVLALFGGWAVAEPPGPAYDGPTWLAVALPLVTAALVPLRRFRPLTTAIAIAVLVVGATCGGVVGAGTAWIGYLPLALALYSLAARRAVGLAVPTAVAAILAAIAAIVFFYLSVLPSLPPNDTPSEVAVAWPIEAGVVAVLLATATALGLAVGWRRRVAAAAAAQTARQAVTEERLRIARELHDVVGHSLSLIAVKATVANHLADEQPGQARDALRIIETTSQDALAEVRRVLGGLRTEADLAPPPGLADLATLVDGVAATGIEVDLVRRGTAEPAGALGLTGYRIVQEALTNVTRHSGAGHCRVLVDTTGTELLIEVDDDGTGPPGDGVGHGLIGMRERAAAFGGTLTAGTRTEGGFTVTARIPIRAAEESP